MVAMDNLEANERLDSDSSVAGATAWRRAFIAVFAVQLLIKLALAVHLPLFGDEAFYWQESRHLAWGYSDLPGMTAWLVALGTGLGGHSSLAVRSVFLLLGALLPWLVVWFARRHFGARAGWQAGLLAMGLPLAGSLGLLALPDVMLTVASMLALLALDAALRSNQWRHWLALSLSLIMALASHYRAGMLLLAGLVFAVASSRGRALWRNPRWYVALALGALGALPALLYNLGHQWVGLAFQTLERNPWSFHADALRQPLEQAIACTPLLYLLLLWAVLHSLRGMRRGAPWDLVACIGTTFLLAYFLFGLFADELRFRVHWPLAGYLPVLAVVPVLARRLWQAGRARLAARAALCLAWVLLALGQVLVLGYLAALTQPPRDAPWLRQHALADTFDGWRQSSSQLAQLLDQPGHDHDTVVADNFRLAAQLDFGLAGSRPVYSLGSPLNRKHGRARQLRDWQLDEDALFARHAGQPVLLAVEETALREHLRPAWLRNLCSRFAAIVPLERVDISQHKRIAFYYARLRHKPLPANGSPDACIIWKRAYAAYRSGLGSL
ncbi:MAG: glycosyltransferase family 39 protein [Rhodanobacteraceae bacterium]